MDKGLAIKLAMEDGSFQDGIRNLNRQMKVIDSEFKAAVGNTKTFGDSLDGLKSYTDKLSKSIDVQKQLIDKYKQKLDDSKKTLDSNVQSQEQLAEKLNVAKQAYENSVSTVGKNTEETKKLKLEVDNLQQQYDKNNEKIRNSVKSIDNQTVSVNNATGKLKGLEKELTDTNNKLKDMEQATKQASTETTKSATTFGTFKEKLKEGVGQTTVFGTKLGDLKGGFDLSSLAAGAMGGAIVAGVQIAKEAIGQLIAKLGELIQETFKIGTEFQAQMSKVAAISGASDKDLEKLTETAREMGASTAKSATESAKALEYMGMAGWDAQQQMDGLKGIVDLSIASGEDLALTSDIVTDALTAFGKTAKDSGKLADIMATASTKSNTNVAMMGETFKYVAPLCGALKYSMEDTAIATGLMANSGIKSSQAGTALRTAITNLIKPTDNMAVAMEQYRIEMTNSDGTIKSLSEVMDMLRNNLGSLAEAEQASASATIFGKEAMSGMLAIINASEADYNKLTEAVYNSAGATEKMAGVMTDNVQGQLTELGSMFEDIKLSLYNAFEPLISHVLRSFSVVVDNFKFHFKAASDFFNSVFNIAKARLDTFITIVEENLRIIRAIVKPFYDLINSALSTISKALESVGIEWQGIIKDTADVIIKTIEFILRPVSALAKAVEGDFKGAFNALIGKGNEASKEVGNSMNSIADTTKISMKGATEEVSKNFEIMQDKAEKVSENIAEALGKFYDKERQEYEKKLQERYGDSKGAYVKIAEEMTKFDEQQSKKMAVDLEVNSKRIQNKYLFEIKEHEKAEKEKTKITEREEGKRNKSSRYNNSSLTIASYDIGTQFHSGGLAYVHKDELIELPRGAVVKNKMQTQSIINRNSNKSSTNYNFGNITVQANNVEEFLQSIKNMQRRGVAF